MMRGVMSSSYLLKEEDCHDSLIEFQLVQAIGSSTFEPVNEDTADKERPKPDSLDYISQQYVSSKCNLFSARMDRFGGVVGVNASFIQQWINSIPTNSSRLDEGHWGNRRVSNASSHGSKGEGSREHQDVEEGDRKKPKPDIAARRQSWIQSNQTSFNSDISSIDQLLEDRRSDPEEVLMNLGFCQTASLLSSQLPARFLQAGSSAVGINVGAFVTGHPDLQAGHSSGQGDAIEQLVSRLPSTFVTERRDSATSLHRQFTRQAAPELVRQSTVLSISSHQSSKNGEPYKTILSKANADSLDEQGFYTDSPPPQPKSPRHRKLGLRASAPLSSSSLSSRDVTHSSSIALSSGRHKPPDLSETSPQTSQDSVFSTDTDLSISRRLRAKLEAIQEKSLNDMDTELSDGISFVEPLSRTESDPRSSSERSLDDLWRERSLTPDNSRTSSYENVTIAQRRKAFAETKSHSHDRDFINQLLDDDIDYSSPGDTTLQSTEPEPHEGAIVFTLNPVEEEPRKLSPIPKQTAGLLQVTVPESFDSVESESGTIVPSPSASPHNLSPCVSRSCSITGPTGLHHTDSSDFLPYTNNKPSASIEEDNLHTFSMSEPHNDIGSQNIGSVTSQKRCLLKKPDQQQAPAINVTYNDTNTEPRNSDSDSSYHTVPELPVSVEADPTVSIPQDSLESPRPSLLAKRGHLLRPPMERSDSDSSGIADVDMHASVQSCSSNSPDQNRCHCDSTSTSHPDRREVCPKSHPRTDSNPSEVSSLAKDISTLKRLHDAIRAFQLSDKPRPDLAELITLRSHARTLLYNVETLVDCHQSALFSQLTSDSLAFGPHNLASRRQLPELQTLQSLSLLSCDSPPCERPPLRTPTPSRSSSILSSSSSNSMRSSPGDLSCRNKHHRHQKRLQELETERLMIEVDIRQNHLEYLQSQASESPDSKAPPLQRALSAPAFYLDS